MRNAILGTVSTIPYTSRTTRSRTKFLWDFTNWVPSQKDSTLTIVSLIGWSLITRTTTHKRPFVRLLFSFVEAFADLAIIMLRRILSTAATWLESPGVINATCRLIKSIYFSKNVLFITFAAVLKTAKNTSYLRSCPICNSVTTIPAASREDQYADRMCATIYCLDDVKHSVDKNVCLLRFGTASGSKSWSWSLPFFTAY